MPTDPVTTRRLDFDLQNTAVGGLRVSRPSRQSTTTTSLASDATVLCPLSGPGKLHVAIGRARVLEFVDGRRNVATLRLRAGRVALRHLMELDEALMAQARKDADGWFDGTGVGGGGHAGVSRAASVDEFFRRSTSTDIDEGIIACLTIEVPRGSRKGKGALATGAVVDLTLELVGLRFLRSHVDLLWRIADATESADTCPLLDAGGRGALYALNDSDGEDDAEILGPTPDERDAMIADLFSRLEGVRGTADARLQEIESLMDLLDDARDDPDGDLHVVGVVSDRLSALLDA